LAGLPPDVVETAHKLANAYPAAVPSQEFRLALRARLITEAERLQREPVTPQGSGLLVPAAVGAAAIAGIALLGWRTRAFSHLIAHAQGQFRTAQGN